MQVACSILLKIYSIVYLQNFQKGLKRQFRKDFENWKNQQQNQRAQGANKPQQMLKGSDVILHLRTSEEREAEAIKTKSGKLKTPNLTLSASTSSHQHLTQRPESQNSHQTEFVNPNHFAKDIHSALHRRKRSSHNAEFESENDPDKLCSEVTEKLKIQARIPSTTEDDPFMSYLQSVSLDIDSKPVDQLRIDSTFDNCQEAYIRFLSVNGHFNSIHSNSISYDDFNNGGCAIFAFDLTSNMGQML